ncbi:MAG: class I SAM-dependent methyltransferase [Flavobacteriales bacterium]|nr:MAG: class I SAM-dependent methyltransferase [Flavobacteriales bacterium]
MENLEQCPLCKNRGLNTFLNVPDHYLTKEVFTLTRCTHCGFAFTNPRPNPNELGRYYGSSNYISHSNRARGLVPALYYLARSIALRAKRRMIARLTSGKTVLDYGCGAGAFLAHMRSCGYTVEGVEPGDEARAIARRTASCPVHPSLADLTQHRFDVITLWHVLEHVPDPTQTLLQLTSLLSPNGILLIAVPDVSSWDSQHYGSLWAALDVPRHLSHFRPRDLHHLAGQSGLRLALTKRLWFDALYISMLSERYAGRGPIPALVLGLAKGTYSNLVALSTGRSTSSMLYVLKKTH